MRNLAERLPQKEAKSTNPPDFAISERGASEERKLKLVSNKERNSVNLAKAKENLTSEENKEKLHAIYLKGFHLKYQKEKGEVGSFALPYASVENEFIGNCLNLTDEEIEQLVREFNDGFKKYFFAQGGLGGDFTIEKHLDAKGIISVVKYIRSQRELYKNSPQEVHYFFEDNLDARYAIDLLEVKTSTNESGDRVAQEINLVQIKSRPPEPNDRDNIQKNHREYYNTVNTFELRERNVFLDRLKKEILLKNAEEVRDLIFDICTDPVEFDPGVFISKLKIENLSDRHKVSLLLRYLARIDNFVPQIRKNKKKYRLTDEEIDTALAALKRLEDKAKQIKQSINVKSPQINSVIVANGLPKPIVVDLSKEQGKILKFQQKK